MNVARQDNRPTRRGVFISTALLAVILLVALSITGTLLGWPLWQTLGVAAATAAIGAIVNAVSGLRQVRRAAVESGRSAGS